MSYRRRYSSRVPDQKTSRFASFQTSKPQRRTSSSPYRSTRCAGELDDQRLPSVPVPRRADDGAVVEHRLRRVAGQVARHEAELDDGTQAKAEHAVVDAVDAAEVVDRPAVDLAVGPEVVVEDGVGAHRLDAELLPGQAQRLLELLADRAPAGRLRRLELAEVLGADHRPPRPIDRARRRRRPDRDLDPRVAVEPSGWPTTDVRPRLVEVLDRCGRRDPVPRRLARHAGGVGVGRMGDRPDLGLADLEQVPRAVRPVSARSITYPAAPSTGVQSRVTWPRPADARSDVGAASGGSSRPASASLRSPMRASQSARAVRVD